MPADRIPPEASKLGLIWSFPALFSATCFAKVVTPSPGMALCGYSVAISQTAWARAAAGSSSRSAPVRVSTRKSSMVSPDPNEPFTWPALLADQTGDGENFMRRYLQIEFCAFRQKFGLREMFSVSGGRQYDV